MPDANQQDGDLLEVLQPDGLSEHNDGEFEELIIKQNSPVFISFASEDVELVRDIATQLEKNSISCWYSARDLTNIDDFNIQLVEQIKKTEIMLVLVTEHTSDSLFVPRELSLATDKRNGKIPKLIPLLVNVSSYPDNVVLFLNTVQYISNNDFDNQESFYMQIVRRIQSIYESKLQLTGYEADQQRRVLLNQQHERSHLFEIDHMWMKNEVRKYITNPKDATLMELVTKHHFAFLYSVEHNGKFAAAINTIDQLGLDKVYECDSRIRLADMMRQSVPPNSGIVIEVYMDMESFVGDVSEREFEQFLSKLKEAGSFFIISAAVKDSHRLFGLSSVNWNVEYSTYDLLMRYSSIYADESEVANLQSIIQKFSGLLPIAMQPREAEQYIHKLLHVIHGNISQEEFESTSKEKTKERIKLWFQQNQDYYDIAFYLTLTIFEEMSYSYVSFKTRLLTQIMQTQLNGIEIGNQHFISRDEYIARLQHVKLVEISHSKYINHLTTEEVVVFNHMDDKLEIWSYIWMQYIHLRPVLIRWIAELIKLHGRVVRKKLSNFIAGLLHSDLNGVHMQMLNQLIRSGNSNNHQLVLDSLLGYMKLDIRHHQVVYSLIDKYSRHTDEPYRQLAIRALGYSQIGLNNLANSLARLYELYGESRSEWKEEIKISLSHLTNELIRQKSFQVIYYEFWLKKLTGSNQGVDKVDIVLLVIELMHRNQALFFNTSKHFLRSFWVPLTFMYYSYKSTPYFDEIRDRVNHLTVGIKKKSELNEQRATQFDVYYQHAAKLLQRLREEV